MDGMGWMELDLWTHLCMLWAPQKIIDVLYFISLDFSIVVSADLEDSSTFVMFDSSQMPPMSMLLSVVGLQLISLFTTSRLQGQRSAWVFCCVYRCQQEAEAPPHQHHVTHTFSTSSPPLCFRSAWSTQMRREAFVTFFLVRSVYTHFCLKDAFIRLIIYILCVHVLIQQGSAREGVQSEDIMLRVSKGVVEQ